MKIQIRIKLRVYLIVLCIALAFNVSGQRFSSVFFEKLPQDYQLYPRNAQNEATVPISGITELPGFSYMSVIVSRNGIIYKYLRAPIKYNNGGIGSFATETTIKAELADYNFKIYACRTTDSTLTVTRQKVVSGDTYIIMGQSNSTGFFTEVSTNDYCRSFGKITADLNISPYNPADTLWTLSNVGANVGSMGFEMQKQLSQSSGIPNCLINGGFHWSSAFSHAQRNADNPADLTTGYGRMLYRVQKAGLANSINAFIYRQGETEAYGEGFDWEKNFKLFYDHLKIDLPSIKKLYVFQIDIIYYPTLVGAELRDYQRRLPDIYPDIKNLATVGTQEFDGLHYGRVGNVQGGFELSRLIKRDLYGSTDTVNINSPNVKKAFYKGADKKELILVFDEGQELIYPGPHQVNPSTIAELKDFIYLDDATGAVVSGSAQGNRITLTLNGTQNASKINYLPPFVEQTSKFHPYTGPYITNKLGMRAFTFYRVGISTALETPSLTTMTKSSVITLEWTKATGAVNYQLDRKTETDPTWKTILVSAGTTFTDQTTSAGTKYNYRLKAMNPASESAEYAYANAEVQVISGTEDPLGKSFEAFPNPVKRNESLTVQFPKAITGTISVFDKEGRKLQETRIKAKSKSSVDTKFLDQGYYFLRFDAPDQQLSKKILVTH